MCHQTRFVRSHYERSVTDTTIFVSLNLTGLFLAKILRNSLLFQFCLQERGPVESRSQNYILLRVFKQRSVVHCNFSLNRVDSILSLSILYNQRSQIAELISHWEFGSVFPGTVGDCTKESWETMVFSSCFTRQTHRPASDPHLAIEAL
jgi:hypothetical protein